jgi:hypothetical protein
VRVRHHVAGEVGSRRVVHHWLRRDAASLHVDLHSKTVAETPQSIHQPIRGAAARGILLTFSAIG